MDNSNVDIDPERCNKIADNYYAIKILPWSFQFSVFIIIIYNKDKKSVGYIIQVEPTNIKY